MGMNDKELSHIRMIANGVVARANEKNKWASAVEARRSENGAAITVSLRSGSERPAEVMLELSDIADAIRMEFRLERNKIGAAVYGTSESTFESEGNPSFSFNVWRLDEI